MATLLDATLLYHFLPFFVFIFIFVLIYAILDKTSMLGSNKSLNFIAALSIALISLFTAPIIDLISFVVPWFVFIFIFLTLLFAGFLFLGIKQEAIWEKINPWTVLIIIFLLLLIGVVTVFDSIFTPYSDGGIGKSIGGETLKTIFHPRVLGALFILIVSAIAIKLISAESV